MQADGSTEYRTLNGENNNQANPEWGAADTQLLRKTTIDYKDKISKLAERGSKNPNPREISNEVCRLDKLKSNSNYLSDFMWAWGQFLDHEIDLTEPTTDESVDIITPDNDPVLPNATIGFTRSAFDPATGTSTDNPRQQITQISAYIDASNVYGSDKERADAVRAFDGTGRLKTSASEKGELLPYNVFELPNASLPGMVTEQLFIAGDIRSNEHAVLSSMHTLFVREHNRLCAELLAYNSSLAGDDEKIYQQARQIVSGIMQAITYYEFLPTLLGANAIAPYAGYNDTVNASVSNVFSTACYRLGHSMLSSTFKLGTNGRTLRLRDAFFKPGLLRHFGIEPFLNGLSNQVMQEIDTKIIEDVRSALFGAPDPVNQRLLDLVSLNIQRGRDHGLPDYNKCRQDYGLKKIKKFSDITKDKDVQKSLAEAYENVDSIDPWIGCLAEDHVNDANVGEFILIVLKDQFERLRDGDRFWFENDPSISEERKTEISNTRLADVIRRNTEIKDISDNVFIYTKSNKKEKKEDHENKKSDKEDDDDD